MTDDATREYGPILEGKKLKKQDKGSTCRQPEGKSMGLTDSTLTREGGWKP